MEQKLPQAESQAVYEDFMLRYQRMMLGDYSQRFTGGNQDEVLQQFLSAVQSEGKNLTLYHGTHSGLVSDVLRRKLVGIPLYFAVSPYQSAQYALQRAWTETGHRRLTHQSSVAPVLVETHIDLRGLDYDVFAPSPYVSVKADMGIGINQDIDTRKYHLFEVQLVGKKAERQLAQGQFTMVASGDNLKKLLHWSKENLGDFPMSILLE